MHTLRNAKIGICDPPPCHRICIVLPYNVGFLSQVLDPRPPQALRSFWTKPELKTWKLEISLFSKNFKFLQLKIPKNS